MKRFGPWLALLVAAGCLWGCGPQNRADDSYVGGPHGDGWDSAPSDADPMDTSPWLSWSVDDSRFALTLWGSSSCVPTAVDIEIGDDIVVQFVDSDSRVCTADMAPTTFEFALPEPRERTPVTIEWPEREGSHSRYVIE